MDISYTIRLVRTESMSKYEGMRRRDYWLYVAHQEIMSYSIGIQLMRHIMVFWLQREIMSGSAHIYNFTDILNARNISNITQALGNSSKLDIFMTVNAQWGFLLHSTLPFITHRFLTRSQFGYSILSIQVRFPGWDPLCFPLSYVS